METKHGQHMSKRRTCSAFVFPAFGYTPAELCQLCCGCNVVSKYRTFAGLDKCVDSYNHHIAGSVVEDAVFAAKPRHKVTSTVVGKDFIKQHPK